MCLQLLFLIMPAFQLHKLLLSAMAVSVEVAGFERMNGGGLGDCAGSLILVQVSECEFICSVAFCIAIFFF